MPCGARPLEQRDHRVALPPHVGAERFDVRDVHGNLRFAADANDLVDRADQSDRVGALVAKMRVVDAALRRGDLRELDHLFGRRVAAGRVVEPGRHADRAIVHRAQHDGAHRVHLRRRRGGGRGSNDGAAHRSLADVDGGVRPDAVLRPPVELLADVDRTAAVVVRDDGGDALHEIRQVRARSAAFERSPAVWVCGSMNPGATTSPFASIVRPAVTRPPRIADEHDPIAADADVRRPRRAAAPVDDRSAANQHVDLLLGRAGTAPTINAIAPAIRTH